MYTIEGIIDLLRAGASGCGWEASESWGDHVGECLGDKACLEELANLIADHPNGRVVAIWVEHDDETVTKIAGR